MRPLEFNGSIGRTNDFSQLKQQEDVKPMAEQQTLMRTEERQTNQESRQVNEQKNADGDKFDAKHGNGSSYEEQENKKRKKRVEEEGVVKIKSSARFDIKI